MIDLLVKYSQTLHEENSPVSNNIHDPKQFLRQLYQTLIGRDMNRLNLLLTECRFGK